MVKYEGFDKHEWFDEDEPGILIRDEPRKPRDWTTIVLLAFNIAIWLGFVAWKVLGAPSSSQP